MRLVIRATEKDVAVWLAKYITKQISTHQNSKETKPFVLGFSADESIEYVCEQLVLKHKNNEIRFANVVLICLEEYYQVPTSNENSTHWKIWHWLLKQTDFRRENVHILDGEAIDHVMECETFENNLKNVGPIDLACFGVASNGGILGNEPGSSLVSNTRIKKIANETRVKLQQKFGSQLSLDQVPMFKLTAGTKTISTAKESVGIFCGVDRSHALRMAVSEPLNHMHPASILQRHRNALLMTDENATEDLSVRLSTYFRKLQENANLNLTYT